jgi:hypothetical protein
MGRLTSTSGATPARAGGAPGRATDAAPQRYACRCSDVEVVMPPAPIPARAVLLAPLVLAALLSGCVRPTPYQPDLSGDGYSERRIEENRYIVRFEGNTRTSRETVETYLLFRAAELTLDAGYDWFRVVSAETLPETWYRAYGPAHPRPWPYHGPWGWYRGPHPSRFGFGFTYYGPPAVVRPETRFEAVGEILMLEGEKPADDPRAYDAADVARRLGPVIRRPES